MIPNNFFEYNYHIGCAINLHSITNSGLIPGGQNLSKRQTVFFTSVHPVNKEHGDPNNIDQEASRLALYQQKKWRRHQDTVYWVDKKNLLNRKDSSSIKPDRTQSSLTTHSQLIVSRTAMMMETGGIKYEKVYASPRLPPKISFKDNWMKELDSQVAGVVKTPNKSNKNPKPNYQARGYL